MGGTYEFTDLVNVASLTTYAHALQQCVKRHPQLSIVVANAESNSPYFEHYPNLDLNEHIQLLDSCEEGEDKRKAIERALQSILDAKLLPDIPAWKVFILPLSPKRCFIAFFYSHTLGDGMSGLAFHQSMLGALEEPDVEKEITCKSTTKQISPAFDTPENLPISWSYFLATLLAIFLPKGILSILGFEGQSNSVTKGTWTASPIFYSAEKHATGVQTILIDGATVDQILRICRSHSAKLTAVLHQLIVHALSQSLPQKIEIDYFAGQTVLSLRGALKLPKDEMGNCFSGNTEIFPRKKPTSEETDAPVDWLSAKSSTERLATRSKTLRDQPIGLLRYVSDIRGWTLSKIGERRDCSYELSNLTTFQPSGPGHKCTVVEMLFCQPANVMGPPLSFNVVSVAKAPLTIAVSWQIGALDLGADEEEERFVNSVCQKIELAVEHLVSSYKG